MKVYEAMKVPKNMKAAHTWKNMKVHQANMKFYKTKKVYKDMKATTVY